MNQTSTSRTTTKRKATRGRMTVILRGVPKGYNWGWFSREEPRMHLQTVDSKHFHDFKVWLEHDGKRVFEPTRAIPRDIREKLEQKVAERRLNVEGRWTNLMIKNGWIE